jgi:hypothetical protein
MVPRVSVWLLVVCLAAIPLCAETDPFIGQWTLSKLSDQMKVTKLGASTFAFDFGGGVETIVVDGTDQPGSAGTTLSVASNGPAWTVIRKKGSHALLTATWTLSKDGTVLKDVFTSFDQTNKPSTVTYVYERKAPGLGFAGTWVSTILAASTAIVLAVRTYENNGLSFVIPSEGQTTDVALDGKYHAAAPAGSALLGRRLNARTVEIVRTSKGKITQTRRIELSPDLSKLTMTVYLAGKDMPNVYVFERR